MRVGERKSEKKKERERKRRRKRERERKRKNKIENGKKERQESFLVESFEKIRA